LIWEGNIQMDFEEIWWEWYSGRVIWARHAACMGGELMQDFSRKTWRKGNRWEDTDIDWRIWGFHTYLLTYLLRELSPSWGAINCAAPQEPPSNLWNPKVQYRIHKSPPLVPILSHINPIHSITSYLSKIHFNIVHLPTSWSS
jgi:hypothetical protein